MHQEGGAAMLKLGDKIIVINDRFEQNMPIGEHGYIIAFDRNNDSAFEYIIRVPKANRQFYVSGDDVMLESALIEQEVDRIERDALIDFALATRNEALFRRLMNGEVESVEEAGKEVQSREDFIKQVNLKAWI